MEAESFPLADRNPYIGPQAVIEGVFAQLGDEVDAFGVAPERFIANEENVVMEGRYIGTGKATAKPCNSQVAHVWIVKGGKIDSYQQHVDTRAVAKATGKVE
ncbi:nuclear transport factor 2 family protein [uncultured Parasphingorhabdus sp.]|uniref:nuclear transport factor 2 family protein n=1 Tax=uncultured Parasphingorhabdus sp. TaxID=2709694 RepID=UPI0030D90AE5|tara:strand:- start:48216 stop:48521 length:306 start_codon:yes stop_codon:yes gene_type:complete